MIYEKAFRNTKDAIDNIRMPIFHQYLVYRFFIFYSLNALLRFFCLRQSRIIKKYRIFKDNILTNSEDLPSRTSREKVIY
ncbi:hypothetical protein K469DRAFT_327177 [Zopfia rhizophila CBS 207.26]|uniref:Uncharacterized protein n=1 Tax=Zopfia rhizophila CBS 207.26 TaxID=1314779 RepID=A0A6A6DM88_9PEZI|nr:hypothetical protein K469DRAFT_327177 [Zopfia rhizophila CBS 207.26]